MKLEFHEVSRNLEIRSFEDRVYYHKRYNEEELHLIGAQFFKDYIFYLDTYDDAESTLRDAQIFTMLLR